MIGYSVQEAGVWLGLEDALAFQVGVSIVTPQALGVLAHVGPLRAWLWRGDEMGKQALVATDWSLRLTKEIHSVPNALNNIYIYFNIIHLKYEWCKKSCN